jgi:ribose 1,5-bisphosphokinase PhnN
MGRSSGIQKRIPNTAIMTQPPGLVFALTAALLAIPAPTPAGAASDRACLSKAEQRTALSGGQTVTLAVAIRSARGSVRGRGSREVVRARLCREEKGLVYLLTMLTRDGKVTHTAVDATSGKVVDAR